MDQDDKLDRVAEAVKDGLATDAAETKALRRQTGTNTYVAALEQLDPDTWGIAVRDPDAELEFYVDPPSWPELRQLIDVEHEKWLEIAPNSPRANPNYQPDPENNWTPGNYQL